MSGHYIEVQASTAKERIGCSPRAFYNNCKKWPREERSDGTVVYRVPIEWADKYKKEASPSEVVASIYDLFKSQKRIYERLLVAESKNKLLQKQFDAQVSENAVLRAENERLRERKLWGIFPV